MNEPLRSVSVETLTVPEIVHKLARNYFLIPTFQRDFVWRPEDVQSLWDSMYRAYPIGSVLCWHTLERLDTHRRIGGFVLEPDALEHALPLEKRYILDGQQRLTSLLVAYLGGRDLVEDEPFDFGLYFDPTANDDPGTDWRDGVFFFANDLNRRRDALRRKGKAPELILRVGDESALDNDQLLSYADMPGYSADVGARLTRLYRLLHQYRIPFISSQGVDLGDVCDIYERINQRGRKLSTADIVVARTFRSGDSAFNLRRKFDDVKQGLSARASQWTHIDNLSLLQFIGICLRGEWNAHHRSGRNPFGIDKDALLNLTPESVEPHWEQIRSAILATLEFLTENGVFSRALLPGAYLPLPLCNYLYRASAPQYDLMRQWFWRCAFDLRSIDSDTDVYTAITQVFDVALAGNHPTLAPLTISLSGLMRDHPSGSSFRLAAQAFLSSLGPRDFDDGHVVTDGPAFTQAGSDATIHHIYPKSFLRKAHATTRTTRSESLMNLSYLSAATNRAIGDASPVVYFATYRDRPEFEAIMASQLIPLDFALRTAFEPKDYRQFLLARARLFAERLVNALPDVAITVDNH